VTAALTGLLCLFATTGASAQQFGSNLQAAPNAGLCPVPSGSFVTSCTFSQLLLADGHAAAGGVQPREEGVITRFRVLSGNPNPGTTSVKLRLRPLEPNRRFTGVVPYVDMPLTPGVHEFPTRLSKLGPTLIGLDTLVTGAAGAAAPLAHAESGAGILFEWVPSLPEAEAPPPTTTEENLELLLNFTLERDRDHDGYGDKTQDRCPEDPQRHVHCDRIPPRTKLTYDPRQDFLHSKPVVVYVRTNEPGRVYAGGQIDIKGVVTWGIYSARKTVTKGKKVKLVLRVPANAREAAARSFAHGRRVTASVTVYATDAAGNESGATVATIRPQR
jgi:hypothetical protein